MSIGEFIKVVGLADFIFLTFMISWNFIYLINKYIDSENNKEIDLDKKGKKMLIWINSKEYFFRPFMNKPPYVEAKLYKKSYVLGIINFLSCLIESICLIIFLILCIIDYVGILSEIFECIMIFSMGFKCILFVTIYEIEKKRHKKRELKNGMKFK